MRSLISKTCLCVLPTIALWGHPVLAQDLWTASLHVGTNGVDRLVKDSGPWWGDVDDDAAAFGVSLSYEASPILRFRVMYEQASDFESVNVCPSNAICPAVVIGEEVDFSAWHAAMVPRYEFAPDWSVFGTLGAKRWELDRDNILPDDSGTAFTYGAGISWQAMPGVELGVEYQASQVDYEALRLNLGYRF